MTAVLSLLLPALVAICLLAACLFVLRAWQARRRADRQVYGVGQVETRRVMRLRILQAIALFVLAAVLLGTWGIMLATSGQEPAAILTPRPSATAPAPTGTSLPPTATETATQTPAATPTETPERVTPTGTSSPTPLPTVTLTETPAPLTATVSSGVGVYLRAEPDTTGAELEWVLDGTVLVVLPGRVQGPEFEWQQVRTPSGNEGWVALPFIRINQ